MRSENSGVVLYPDMESKTGDENLPQLVIDSYFENRKLHETRDDRKEKSLKFVHGEQWDEEVEAERANFGLTSLVADKTKTVWRTLDGYARRNQKQVKYVQVGDDDFDGAVLHDKIFTHISTQSNLNHMHAKCYGTAAIADEAFLYLYPQLNSMGRVCVGLEDLDAFECYPDANFKDPIRMRDAEFIDIPLMVTPQSIKRKYAGVMESAFKKRLDEFQPHNPYDEDRTRNQYKYRESESAASANGLVLLLTRFYKKYKTVTYIVNPDDQSVEPLPPGTSKGDVKAAVEQMGFDLIDLSQETLWMCVVVPDVTHDDFLMNVPAQFQPINPEKIGEIRWPVVRYVHNLIGGKASGAIGDIIKLNEARNSILSALLHHLQTAANGGLLYETGAFGGDSEEEEKFIQNSNRAGYRGKVAKDALKEKRIAPVPKGEFAFQDGGPFLEEILSDVIRDVTGSEPVMKGQAQKGAPASLYAQQVEQSQSQLMSSTEYFQQSQDLTAELIYAFTRQFYTEQRVLQIEGDDPSNPEKMVINEQRAGNYLNDPAHGLFTVYKTSTPVTESTRRRLLGDALEVATTLANIGVPTFVQDLSDIINNLPISQDRKRRHLQQLTQWQQTQGIGDQVALQQQQAVAQKAANEAVPPRQPVRPA